MSRPVSLSLRMDWNRPQLLLTEQRWRRGVLESRCDGRCSIDGIGRMTDSVSITVEQLSSANPVAVYDVLMDVERWPEWMPTVSAASWEREGAPETGQGGIRRVRAGLTRSRDSVIGGMRPRHHAYTAALSAFSPLTDYRGDVRIEERPNGSLIIYTVTCTSRIPGLAKSVRKKLNSVYTRLAVALAQEAERVQSSKDR